MAYLAVRLAFGDEFEHFGRETVRLDALTWSPPEHDTAFLSSRIWMIWAEIVDETVDCSAGATVAGADISDEIVSLSALATFTA